MSTHHNINREIPGEIIRLTTLSYRAEELCRRYLPDGRRQGNYWTIGNLDGDKGRSLYVCLAPPGRPGKWTDASTDEHGDLLDIIQHHTPDRTFPAALAAARAFLGHPPAEPKPAQRPSTATPPPSPPPDNKTPTRVAAARTLWAQCTPLPGTHAEDGSVANPMKGRGGQAG